MAKLAWCCFLNMEKKQVCTNLPLFLLRGGISPSLSVKKSRNPPKVRCIPSKKLKQSLHPLLSETDIRIQNKKVNKILRDRMWQFSMECGPRFYKN